MVKPALEFSARIPLVHAELVSGGKFDPNEAAAEALRILMDPAKEPTAPGGCIRYLAVLSLAEGETIRRALHINGSDVPLALRTLDGGVDYAVDCSTNFTAANSSEEIGAAMQCLRFLNCDMYYTDVEMDLLLNGLQNTPINDRIAFFSSCQVSISSNCLFV